MLEFCDPYSVIINQRGGLVLCVGHPFGGLGELVFHPDFKHLPVFGSNYSPIFLDGVRAVDIMTTGLSIVSVLHV
jgi:hypothetical protein